MKQGREYALRVYRVDAELLEVIPDMSPRLGELAAQAAAASPGQRYLLERKLDGEKRGEMRSVSQQIVDDIVEQLGRHAVESVRSPIPRAAERRRRQRARWCSTPRSSSPRRRSRHFKKR